MTRRKSLADLGQEVLADRSYLAKIERGERPAPADLIARCDEALNTSGALTRLHGLTHTDSSERPRDPLSNEDHDRHVANHRGHVASGPVPVGAGAREEASLHPDEETFVPVRASNGRIVYVPLPRRRLLQDIGVAAAALAAGPAVLSSKPLADAGAPPVEHFRKMRAALAESDNLFGPRRVIPTAHEQVNLMQELGRSTRGADLQSLLGAQTEYADLLGWLHQDSGDHHAAQFWLDRALEWSHLSGDRAATAFILARKSQLASDMGDGIEAIEVAEAAMRTAEPRSRLAAVAATYAVHGHALQGDHDACAEAYDHAREMLNGADEDQHPWGQFFDASYIDIHHAESQTLLGNYLAAAEEYRSAIAVLPEGFDRDRGVYIAREALAYAGADEAERAVELGMQALAIGARTKSGRITKELTRVSQALRERADLAGVRDFREAVHAVASQPNH